MPFSGSITPNADDKISYDQWMKILAEVSGFQAINSANITNPMNGESIPMTSPPNKLAEFAPKGKQLGIIWLPVEPYELGFEGNGPDFKNATKEIAMLIDGALNEY